MAIKLLIIQRENLYAEFTVMAAEKRKQVRYKLKRQAFVAFVDSGSTRVGRLVNISLTGAGFEHFMDDGASVAPNGTIDIFVAGREVYITGIPCRGAYNYSQLTKNSYISSLVTNRGGVEFGVLSPEQKKELTQFIDTCAEKNG